MKIQKILNLAMPQLDDSGGIGIAAGIAAGIAPRENGAVELSSKAIERLFTLIRDRCLPPHQFCRYASRLMILVAEEGIAHLPTSEKLITTPTDAAYKGISVNTSNVCAVSIIRAGDSLLEAVRACEPQVSVGKILIQRDESTVEKTPVLSYVKLPPGIGGMDVLLCDPMLATGGSAILAIRALVDAGVDTKRIVFINVISCPEGLEALESTFPEVKVVTGHIDDCLNDDKFILPGLGDFGDRYFGT